MLTPEPRTPSPPPAEVFITGELLTRPPRTADARLEKSALQDLASRMVDRPDEVLPRFVELAMEFAGGTSAGLSLFEPSETGEGVFRWHHVQGSLARFAGATTPRNYSPCGICLDVSTPILTRHSELLYSWISDVGIVVPEVLLVPLFLGGSEPLGTLWIVSEEEGAFDSEDARIATELATFVGIAVRMQRDREQLQRALAEQETLTREMSHRVKNLFAVTDSMVRFSARSASSIPEMADILSGRLRALSTAHELVIRGLSTLTTPASELSAIAHAIVRPHESVEGERFDLAGPKIAVNERLGSNLALALHELTTNAIKYGALASEDGRVSVIWGADDTNLKIRWAETGGAVIAGKPKNGGFGSKLITGAISQYGGTVEQDWRPEGLAVTLSVPLGALG